MALGTASSKRLEIVAGPGWDERAQFARDVRDGLSAARKSLPPKYFYDAVGSALFEAITRLPEYYLTRAETAILAEYGWEIVRAIGNPFEVVELGGGNSTKTRMLIEEALRVQRSLRYRPVDIAGDALRDSARSLVAAYPELRVTAYEADYFGWLESGALRAAQRTMVLFLGSNIGNYEPARARQLLRAVAAAFKPGDGLLLGADLRKDRAVLEAAYGDPPGVTAAFNKNLLARINRELGGHFDLQTFRHIVEYDEHEGCVRSFLESRIEQSVAVDALDRTIAFAKNERIHTESSYKYALDEIAQLAQDCGLVLARTWTDEDQRFSVNVLTLDDT